MAVNRLHVKKDDLVMIIAGKEKGKTGKVLRVFPGKERVVVESLNIVKRHSRASKANTTSGIVEKEAPLNVSNVMVVCGACNKATRTGIRTVENGKRARFCKKCNELVDRK